MRRIAAFVFAVLLALPAVPRWAQEVYPSRPITMISPYAPGGASDFLARTLAEALKARLHPAGAGAERAGRRRRRRLDAGGSKAKPDGYTLLLNHIGLSTIPSLYKKLDFDPLASFEFIGLFAEGPMVILSRKDFAPRTFAELVAYAKANKEKLTFASSGMGSATHLCAMLFQEAIGTPLTMVQYKGAGPADARHPQRPGRPHLRPADDHLQRHPLGRPQGLRADRPQAHGLAARRADGGRGRHAEPRHEHLVRPLRAARHAQAGPRNAEQGVARRRGRQGGGPAAREDRNRLFPVDKATPEALRAKLASQIDLWRPIIEKAGIQAE